MSKNLLKEDNETSALVSTNSLVPKEDIDKLDNVQKSIAVLLHSEKALKSRKLFLCASSVPKKKTKTQIMSKNLYKSTSNELTGLITLQKFIRRHSNTASFQKKNN